MILVDQRGTGGSHPLDCPTGEVETGPGAASADSARKAAAACLAQLDVDPTHFTTTDAVADLDDVRASLGAERINLVGVSYGTRLALEYLRRHPDRTRSVVLDGVVPPTLALGADHGRNLDAALAQYFSSLRGSRLRRRYRLRSSMILHDCARRRFA